LWKWHNQYQSQFHFKQLLPCRFALKHLVKDLRLAKEAGLDTPLIHPLYDSYAAAQEGLAMKTMAIITSLRNK
jgi:3-hydroxyisobutyrate dehydrogenase